MLDEEPLAKKVIMALTLILWTITSSSFLFHRYIPQARKASDAVSSKDLTKVASASKSSPIKPQKGQSLKEDVISPSPKKSPIKTSSKLAVMKKKDEERQQTKNKMTFSPKKVTSPKMEPSLEKKHAPKAGTSLISLHTSPKKTEVKKKLGLVMRVYLCFVNGHFFSFPRAQAPVLKILKRRRPMLQLTETTLIGMVQGH